MVFKNINHIFMKDFSLISEGGEKITTGGGLKGLAGPARLKKKGLLRIE